MTQIISDIVKVYPHMYKIIIWHNSFKLEVGNMPIKNIDLDPSISSSEAFNNKNGDVFHDNAQRSLRRTKTNVEDIVLCNKFDLWCTFTFDKRRVDRYDANRCKSIIRMWLHNQRSHSPNLKYLIVPEFHKKCEECIKLKEKVCTHSDRSKAIHFHALLANYNGKLKLAKHKNNKIIFDKHSKTPVYNISSYRSGFSTAIPLISDNQRTCETSPCDNLKSLSTFGSSPSSLSDSAPTATYYALAKYLTKYITKDMPELTAGNRYFCSTNLNRPQRIKNGVGLLKLSDFLKNRQPAYIDDVMEIQYIPILDLRP